MKNTPIQTNLSPTIAALFDTYRAAVQARKRAEDLWQAAADAGMDEELDVLGRAAGTASIHVRIARLTLEHALESEGDGEIPRNEEKT